MDHARHLILALSLLLVACGKQSTSAWQEPSYGPAVAHELSDQGKIHRYTEKVISPAYRLTGVPVPEESQLTRPELVLIRHAHAITQTFDWNMSNALWDPASRAAFEAQMAKFKETPEDRVKNWKEGYKGKQLELYKRLDIPGYVLFYVGVVGEPQQARQMAVPLVVKEENKRWWLTHDLRENPVASKDFLAGLRNAGPSEKK
jgi:hypothetical protein